MRTSLLKLVPCSQQSWQKPHNCEAQVRQHSSPSLASCRCCAALAPIFTAQCGCNPDFLAIRDSIQEAYPVLTPAYLQGVNYILALACGLPDTSCA